MAYLDVLKVVIISGAIAWHGVMSYVDGDFWPYANVQETHLSDGALLAVFAVMGPIGLFMMAMLFLVAGLLTPGAVDRKGVRRFTVDRVLRLGVPFLVFVLLLWPAALYLLYRTLGHVSGSYWFEFSRNFPDNGPMWFVGLLLLLSLAYAAWRRTGLRRPASSGPRVTTRGLLALAAAVALLSFVVRLVWPYGSQTPLELGEWQWPECVALFALGVVAARQGWLTAVPRPIARAAGRTTLAAGAATLLLVPVAALSGAEPEDFLGGPHPAALLLATVEGLLTVFGSVWLLALAQRRLDHPVRHLPALARASYPAFVLGAFVVVALAVALRPLPAPAEAKAVVVAALGVTASFGLARLLPHRPGVRRSPR